VRLVPAAPIPNDLWKRPERVRTLAKLDAFFLVDYLTDTVDDIKGYFEILRETDYETLVWLEEMGVTPRPSKVSQTYLEILAGDLARGEKLSPMAENYLRALEAADREGANLTQIASDCARDMGMQFVIGWRMGAWAHVPPFDRGAIGHPVQFWRDHPQFRVVNRDGGRGARMSFVFPQVRQYVLSMIREAIEDLEPDGVNLTYVRAPAFVGYERPAVEAFQKRYGRDPREIAPSAEEVRQWRTFQTQYLTTFMRDLRKMADEASQKRRRPRLEISAVVFGDEQSNLDSGIDLAAWVRDGSIDLVTPYATVRSKSPVDMEFFARLREISHGKLQICPMFVPPERPEAVVPVREGSDGVFVWDAINNQIRTTVSAWPFYRRLGALAEGRITAEEIAAERQLRRIAVKEVNGVCIEDMDPSPAF
jgi:hypothetical protein